MNSNDLEWLSLESGEQIIWEGGPRLKSIIPAVLGSIPFVPVLGLGLAFMAGAYYSNRNTDYVVTNEGLYVKKGVFSRSVEKIGHEKVQNISFSQGILGSRYNYGTIEISTAGDQGVGMRFRNIENPQDVQERINSLIKKSGAGSAPEDRRSKRELMEEILSELKEINEKL